MNDAHKSYRKDINLEIDNNKTLVCVGRCVSVHVVERLKAVIENEKTKNKN